MTPEDTQRAKEYIYERLPFHALRRYAFNQTNLRSDWTVAANTAAVTIWAACLTQAEAPTEMKVFFGAIAGAAGFTSFIFAAHAMGSVRQRLDDSKATLRPEDIAAVEEKLRDPQLRRSLLHFKHLDYYR